MTFANKLTLLRILLVPVFMVTLSLNTPTTRLIALFIFIIAAITDFVDGYVARRYNQITNLGKVLDPVADKVLVAAALIGLVELNEIAAWIAVLIISREFLVSVLRILVANEGRVLAAGQWGKAKTTMQMIAILLLLTHNYPFRIINIRMDLITLYVAAVLTVISGVEYVYRNRGIFKS